MSEEEFTTIDVDLGDTDPDTLVKAWLVERIHPASLFEFNHLIDSGTPFRDAVHAAIMNDFCLNAMIEYAQKVQAEGEKQ